MEISAIKIENFKRIAEIEIPAVPLTILIGGNNSGKSSLLQAIHFAVTTLQSAKSASGKTKSPSTTLGVDQFIYKPTNDLVSLHHGKKMTQHIGPTFNFSFSEAHNPNENKIFKLSLRRGKNANISVLCEPKSPFFDRASDRTQPLSIFVPGLAGVSLREEKRTDSIVNVGIAQGDSNLYLRNVLLRIIQHKEKLDRFHSIIRDIFPELELLSSFDEKTNPYIEIHAYINGQTIPLEMVGTGCLQAIQLVAYVTMYDPALLLLDEPDSHLHPSNQRILASTLARITETSNTKIVLATHSRHMFDTLTYSSQANVVWLKDGKQQAAQDADDLSILLDLGALDNFELIQTTKGKVVVLTEDDKSPRLQKLLEVNGFKKGEYFLQSFKGVGNISAAKAIAEFFLKLGSGKHVLVHRDGDCMLPEEKEWLRVRSQNELPTGCEFFITDLTDIEHYFCQPEHISHVLGISLDEARSLVQKVIDANRSKFAIDFTSKRIDLKQKTLREMKDVPSAADLVKGKIEFPQIKGKSLYGQVHHELQLMKKQANKLSTEESPHLNSPFLQQFSAKVWL